MGKRKEIKGARESEGKRGRKLKERQRSEERRVKKVNVNELRERAGKERDYVG